MRETEKRERERERDRQTDIKRQTDSQTDGERERQKKAEMKSKEMLQKCNQKKRMKGFPLCVLRTQSGGTIRPSVCTRLTPGQDKQLNP